MPETVQETALEGLSDNAKLKLADKARLMLNNQKTLNTTDAADRAQRDQQHRFREMELQRMNTEPKGIEYPKDDEVQVSIDSPVTTNNYHATTPQGSQAAPAGEWSVAKLATAVGIPSAALAAMGWMFSGGTPAPPPAQPVVTQEQISQMIGHALSNLEIEAVGANGEVVKTYPILPPK